jgi:hypothetical protein
LVGSVATYYGRSTWQNKTTHLWPGIKKEKEKKEEDGVP